MPARPPLLPILSLSVLALAGCAAPPVPLAARLGTDALVLEMSGGQTCRLPRAAAPKAGPEGWGGPVQGCAGVARVDVAAGRPGPAQWLLGDLALGRLFAPQALVQVTGSDGRRHSFDSPVPPRHAGD